MKIKIKLNDGGRIPQKAENGDWYDIFMPKDGKIEGGYANVLTKNRTRRTLEYPTQLVELGFAMELPKHYEAIIAPRSGTYKKYDCTNTNNIGVIDNKYKGDNDTWKAHIKADKDCEWKAGDRLFQFRIFLNQSAPVWVKIKWLFWNGKIEFVPVNSLGNKDRGGFGSTGR